jgi:hypothetical protein
MNVDEMQNAFALENGMNMFFKGSCIRVDRILILILRLIKISFIFSNLILDLFSLNITYLIDHFVSLYKDCFILIKIMRKVLFPNVSLKEVYVTSNNPP